MTNKRRVESLEFAIAAVETMHGSVTGDNEFDHVAEARLCGCSFGVCIRDLRDMRLTTLIHSRAQAARRKTKQVVQ